MRPEDLAVRMQELEDRGRAAAERAQAAGRQAMTVRPPAGHVVLGGERKVRVIGPRAAAVARGMASRASAAAVKALKGTIR